MKAAVPSIFLLSRKAAAVLLLVSITLAPFPLAFAQEVVRSDPGLALTESDLPAAPDPSTDLHTVVDPEVQTDATVEPPMEDEEDSTNEAPLNSELERLALKAGGASSGLSFQIPTQPQATVDQSTGALVYEYPIDLPEGRAGLKPELVLRYNSRDLTKLDSIVGLGWDISIPYIQREPIRGTQNLYAKPFFSSSTSGNLVATTDVSLTPYSMYRPESDDGSYLKYFFNTDNSWTVAGKAGRTYTFGGSAASRQDNPSDSSKVYRWMVSKIADAHGNEIQYTYTKDQGQIYPSQIVYTYQPSSPAVHTVSFAYTTPSSYGSTAYNAAFPVVTAKLLSAITVTTTVGADTTTDAYTLSRTDAQFLKQKILISVQRVTNFPGEYNQPFGDTTSFSYSTKTPGWEQGTHSLEGYLTYSDDTLLKDIYTADFDLNGYPDVFVSYRYRNTLSNYLMLNSGTQFTDATASWSLPTNVDLSQDYAITDLNGDRLPDLLPRGSDQAGPVYLNTGTGFASDASGTWLMGNYVPETVDCGPNVGDSLSYGTNAFLYDMNGDGKNDIVYFGGTGSDFKVSLNNGNGWTQSFAYTFTINPGSNYHFADDCSSNSNMTNENYQSLLDMNGDGLLDYVHQRYGTYLNNGYGFAYSAAYSLNVWDMSQTGLADINGDNLIDYVAASRHSGNNCMRVYLNNGAGFTMVNPSNTTDCNFTSVWNPSEFKYWNDSSRAGTLIDVTADGFPDIVGPFNYSTLGKVRAINDARKTWMEVSLIGDPWTPIVSPAHGVFFDINTDGVIDFIATQVAWDGQQQAASKVYMGKAAVPNRLVEITSVLGAQTVVEYSTAPTNYSDTDVAPMPVVEKLTVQNIGHDQPTMMTQYAYSGGAYTADPATGQRRFAGFHKVTATESGSDLTPLRVTDTYFYQANGSDSATMEPADTSLTLIGKPYYTVVRHPSGIPKKETWQKFGTHTLATEPMTGRTTSFAYPTETVVKTTESSATTGTAEVYTFDTTLGERTELRSMGFVIVGPGGSYTDIAGDTRYQLSEYGKNASSTIVKPARVDIRTSPSSSDTISHTEYFYDGQPLGSIGAFGDLTKESKWISGNGATIAHTIFTYDSFGNVLTVTNPRSAVTTFTHDSTSSLVASTTNALGHTTAYEYLAGKLKKITDPNGRVTTYGYSNKGWLYQTTVANTGGSQRTRQHLDESGTNWAIASYAQLVNAREDQSWQSVDNLGRPVRLVRRLLNHTTGDSRGFYLKEARAYDALGREIKRSPPYGVSDPSSYTNLLAVSVPGALVATTVYDIFDRPLAVTNALGTTTFAYTGPETLTTDANGKTKRTKIDAYGNLVEVKEYNAASTYTTSYAYDARNLLTGVTDALGNVRSFTYNNAGWLTNSEDLHAVGDSIFGTWAFTYDAVGNQLTETQPDGTVVTRVFDLLDRPTSIDVPSTLPTDFTFTYDSCTKGIGRLCGVLGTYPKYGLTLNKSFVYGASLPLSTTVTTLGNTYTTSYQYTFSDEPSRITYPDGTVVRYVFGDWALPSTVYTTLPGGSETTYATAAYHHTLQPETVTISSGPTLSYAYDTNKLYRPLSFTAVMGVTTLQSYAYSYDNLNNVTQVVEPGLTKTYVYDDLSRLIQAAHAPSTGGSTTFTYSYNAIGNITSANGTAYSYSGKGKANPHAVSSIGNDLYFYDNNGNVITTPSQILAYNWQNQPVSVISGADSTIFAYDETGERFLYQTPNTTEVQVSEEYLVRGGAPEIVVKLGTMPIGLMSGGTAYATITDHLGTPVKQINPSGTAVENTSYGPFGAVLSSSGTLNSKRGYTGHEEDTDTGLVYAEARYYSPLTQRFFQQDPLFIKIGVDPRADQALKDPQLLNAYSYARNNPVVLTDPDGELAHIAVGALVGIGIGLIGQGLEDAVAGQYSGYAAYVGAASGGAVMGAITAGTGGLSLVPAIIAGMSSGVVQSGVEQGLNIVNGKQENFRVSDLLEDAALSGIASGIRGPKIAPITAGKGSFEAVQKQVYTKLKEGTISVSGLQPSTVGKIVVSSLLQEGPGVAAQSTLTVTSRQLQRIQREVDSLVAKIKHYVKKKTGRASGE